MGNKEKIDTLIISDIHLGDESTRCNELMKLLDSYDFYRLILNGDILDGLKFKRLHTEHWDILSRFRELSKNVELVWVHGNHDAKSDILHRLLGINIYNKYIWESGGKKFMAIHGHQFDRFWNENFIISYMAYGFYSFVKWADKSQVLAHLIKKYSSTWQRSSLEVAKGALRLARLLKVGYVFCGHTHKIYQTEKKHVHYYNTGSWNEKPSGYIAIKDKTIELKQIE